MNILKPLRKVLRALPEDHAPSKIWLAIGRALHEIGYDSAALPAVEYALELAPSSQVTRRLLRRISGRDVSLPENIEAIVGKALAEAMGQPETELYCSASEQVMSGNGANTKYVAKHLFSGPFEKVIFEKCFYTTKFFPREALVYQSIDKIPNGRFYRFPQIYGQQSYGDTYSVFMEAVETPPTTANPQTRFLIRAKALGEFAGRCRDITDLDFLNVPAPDHKIKIDRCDVFESVSSKQELNLFKSNLEKLVAYREELLHTIPTSLVKGDAQPANLIMDENKYIVFIDNGRVGRGPIGEDLASLLWGILIKDEKLARTRESECLSVFHKYASELTSCSIKEIRQGYGCQLVRLLYLRLLHKYSIKTKATPDQLRTIFKKAEFIQKVALSAFEAN